MRNQYKIIFFVLANLMLIAPQTFAQNRDAVSELTTKQAENSPYQLTLDDAVYLALENNRNLKITYLNRVLQRKDLEESQDIFSPTFTPELSAVNSINQNGTTISNNQRVGVGATLNWSLPTGGNISFQWQGRAQSFSGSSNTDDSLDQGISVGFQQPLLRGFGSQLNRLSIRRAELNETENELAFRNAIAQTITSTILAYRNLIRAQERLAIDQLSLDNSRRELERLNALYNFGRIPRNNLVEREADIARQELSLVNTQSQLDQAIANLAQLLDLPAQQTLVAIERPQAPESLNLEEFDTLLSLNLANSDEYLAALNAIERADFSLIEARDQQKWNLQLGVDYGLAGNNNTASTEDLVTRLVFNREFGRAATGNAVTRSEIGIQTASLNLEQIRQNIERDLQITIRNLRDSFTAIRLATESRELAEQTVENAKQRRQSGSGNFSVTDIIEFEQELVTAKNDELSAVINHLNQVTQFEQDLGLTLEFWQVTPTLPEVD